MQAREWIAKFSDQALAHVGDLTGTLDKAQKIFDQVMSQLNVGGEGEDLMLHDTFNLFDVSNTGTISVQDLQEVSSLYQIPALQGEKAKELHEVYDADSNGTLTRDEFALFVHDDSVPAIMQTVLRSYATRLSQVAGVVGSAERRDDVAEAVVEYLQIVSAKNSTKVFGVAERLTDGSLPLEFTVDVLAHLALSINDPNLPTTADVGELVVRKMVKLDPDYVASALSKMSNSTFWQTEGFNPSDQAACVEQVTTWISAAQMMQDDAKLSPELKQVMLAQAASFENLHHGARIVRHRKLYSHPTAQMLMIRLLDGAPALDESSSQKAVQMTQAGKPAAKETLEFAKALSMSAATTAKSFQEQCSVYSGDSSSAFEGYASQIEGMAQKVVTFLGMIKEYASDDGINNLEMQIETFAAKGAEDLVKVVENELSALVNRSAPQINAAVSGALHSAGAELGKKIGEVLEEPFTRELAGPLKDILVDLTKDNQSATMLSNQLGSRIGDAMANLTSEMVGDTIGDLLEKGVGAMVNGAAGGINGALKDILSLSQEEAAATEEENTNAGDVSHLMQIQAKGIVMAVHRQPQEKSTAHHRTSLEMLEQELHADVVVEATPGEAWSSMVTELRSLLKILPQGVEAIKSSRKSVVQLSSTLDLTFENFMNAGPNIFSEIASMTKKIWIIYYCIMVPLTLGLLGFAFWTCGFFAASEGADKAVVEEVNYPEPVTIRDRLRVCWTSCTVCLNGNSDSAFCFWSLVLLLETVVLIAFIITIILVVFAEVERFMQSNCMKIYILGDQSVCTDALEKIREFADQFLGVQPLTTTCDDFRLLLCKQIKDSMMASASLTTIGSVVATILSFQMIIESAILHERSRLKHVMSQK
eukprot:gnl/TRDRNA2_/TRDRNA2_86820_c0_seq1.p1 gnl/TRDRNA2_/TRDRNA2_86820_c0~~gnl/TRDRNA2_/TRDRNA2_86820_c0_seq1.p1  ORF type:complete len:875 (+),score=166.63 gnl/TRDRNA2_/TRDRNA2_86820_c0_seq1:2-2626(+)